MSTVAHDALYCLMLLLAWRTSEGLPARHPARLPWPAVALWLLVAVPSMLQFAFPQIYDALHRDSGLIQHHGQWWRPYTSFLVQDGGLTGAAFNLLALALVAVLAVRLWGTARAMILFFGSIVLYSVVVFLVPMQPGGGNSGPTFTLAASLAGLAVIAEPCLRTALAAALIAADGVLLLFLGDAHGVTMLVGLVLGAVAALSRRAATTTAGPPPGPDATLATRPSPQPTSTIPAHPESGPAANHNVQP